MDAIRVPTLYLRTLVELSQEMGCDPRPWLQACDIDPKSLSHPDMVLSTKRYVELVRLAILHTKDPALGLLLGRRLRMNTHGKLSFALMNSANLGQAIALLERFFPLRTNLLSVRFAASTDSPRLLFTLAVDLHLAERVVIEAVMLAVRNVFEYLSPGGQAVRAVSFAAASTRYESLTSELFGCPVHYMVGHNVMHLNATALNKPLTTADADALEHASFLCQAELDKLAPPESLTARIQHQLLGSGGNMPSLHACARMLHMAPRTLHRRLQDEDTSYRVILDQVRHHLALQHLRNSTVSLQEIAYRLGYSDQANFRRAFKRWEGLAPKAVRDEAVMAPNEGAQNAGKRSVRASGVKGTCT